jgi:hypothetical protein
MKRAWNRLEIKHKRGLHLHSPISMLISGTIQSISGSGRHSRATNLAIALGGFASFCVVGPCLPSFEADLRQGWSSFTIQNLPPRPPHSNFKLACSTSSEHSSVASASSAHSIHTVQSLFLFRCAWHSTALLRRIPQAQAAYTSPFAHPDSTHASSEPRDSLISVLRLFLLSTRIARAAT